MNWATKPPHYGAYEVNELTKWLKINHLDSIDYWPDTIGVCQLNDLNNLLTRDRRARRIAGIMTGPTSLLLGTFELEQLRHVAFCGAPVGGLFPDPPRLKGLAKQRWLDDPRNLPLFDLIVYPLKTFSCFRLL